MAALPEGWQQITTPAGRDMYLNTNTGSTHWEVPAADPVVPEGWQEINTPDGRTMYLDTATGETVEWWGACNRNDKKELVLLGLS